MRPVAAPPPHVPAERPIAVPHFVPVVDGLRGACALLVAIFHCWLYGGRAPLDGGPLLAFVAAGHLAVDFFFVLSGFVLFLPVARHGSIGSIASYATRRSARIVPAYYAAILVQAIVWVPLLGATPVFSSVGGVLLLGLHFAFLQYEIPSWLVRSLGYSGGVVGFGINGALWTLSIEAMFYVALPLVASRYVRRPFLGLAVALAGALLWRWGAYLVPSLASVVGATGAVDHPEVPRLARQLPGYAAHFAFGMTGAAAFAHLYPLLRQPASEATGARGRLPGLAAMLAPGIAAIALAVLVAATIRVGTYNLLWRPIDDYQRYAGDIVAALAFAVLLVALALGPSRWQAPLTNRPARGLGDISYGMYLWHTPIVLSVAALLGIDGEVENSTWAVVVVLVLAATLLAGWISRRWIEEPAIRFARARVADSIRRPPRAARS